MTVTFHLLDCIALALLCYLGSTELICCRPWRDGKMPLMSLTWLRSTSACLVIQEVPMLHGNSQRMLSRTETFSNANTYLIHIEED